jgi:N-alpha-acetyltransferase 50
MSQAQPSILSYFQPRQPNHVPPPGQPPLHQPIASKPSGLSASAPPVAGEAAPSSLRIANLPRVVSPADTSLFVEDNPNIHPQARISHVQEHHIPALRRINSLLLPVNYSGSFYTPTLDPQQSGRWCRVILWREDPDSVEEKVVGGIVCRLEPSPFHPQPGGAGPLAIYIQSLALLSPYRGHGLAAAAFDSILRTAAVAKGLFGTSLGIAAVYAHVWTENADGLAWYAARGFRREGDVPLEAYYFKLRPGSAWIVRKNLATVDVEAMTGSPQHATAQQPAQAGQAPPKATVTAEAVNLPAISTAVKAVDMAPPKSNGPSPAPSGRSFQNARPETEWNDLPEEMMTASGRSSRSNLLSPPLESGPGSGTSSRSSSTARKKKDRSYPAAAFGD